MPDDEASLAMTSRLHVFQSEMTHRFRKICCAVLYIKDPQLGIPRSVCDKLISILIERWHPIASNVPDESEPWWYRSAI